MSTIESVALAAIDPNPYRDLNTYPWIEAKVEQLMRSIGDVGFWEGVIARRLGERFQLAFGHHRIEAARRLGLSTVPLIVRPLSDGDMLGFMGRENGEDYRSDFPVMLNTWDGAVRFGDHRRQNPQPLEIARLLGWTVTTERRPERMTHLAAACAAAHTLIKDGHLGHADLRGQSVHDAREILTRVQTGIERLARIGRREGHRIADTKRAQAVLGKSARITLREAREGRVAAKALRAQVDLNTLRVAHKAVKPVRVPLFGEFADTLCAQIDRMLDGDSAAEKIEEIARALPTIELEEDRAVVRRVDQRLRELARRCERLQRRFAPDKTEGQRKRPGPRPANATAPARLTSA